MLMVLSRFKRTCLLLPRLVFLLCVAPLPIHRLGGRDDFSGPPRGSPTARLPKTMAPSGLVFWIPSWRCNPKLRLLQIHSRPRVSRQETGVGLHYWPFSCSFACRLGAFAGGQY